MERVIGNYTSQENRSFPLDCETLEAIQNNIDMLGALGNMVGDKTILSGCQPKANGGREEGYVFLKTTAYPMGEVLHFAGSSENSDYLHLVTSNGNVTQGEVTYNGAYTTRQVAQGTGAERWAWAELKEPVDIEAIAASLREQMASIQVEMAKIKPVPLGVVEMYSGSAIPDNYAICDGQAFSQALYPELYAVLGTKFNKADTAAGMFCLPDLRGRFIVGQGSDADYNTIGKTGGEKTHLLTPQETAMVDHNHTATCSQGGEHSHKIYSESGNDGGSGQHELGGGDNGVYTGSAGSHTHTIGIGQSGSWNASKAHENRPPYFVLFYIMRLK
ncbi:MAG: tail fiber protein [Prevotella sp.]|nr:tail fiber protein [Candidatus Prevotella equi]